MPDQNRGDDAADHAPKPNQSSETPKTGADKQDAANYADRIDKGAAEPAGKINSANDE